MDIAAWCDRRNNSAVSPRSRRGHRRRPAGNSRISQSRCAESGIYSADNGEYLKEKEQLHGETTLWNPATGERAHTLAHPKSRPKLLAYSPTGKYVAIGVRRKGWGDADQLILWDPQTGGTLRTWDLDPDKEAVACLAISPDGRHLATGSKTGEVLFRDTTTGQVVRSWKTPRRRTGDTESSGGVSQLAYRPDGQEILIACTYSWDAKKADGASDYKYDHRALVCDIENGTMRRDYPGEKSEPFIGYMPGGRQVMIEDTLWDNQAGQKVRKLRGESPNPKGVFAGDGRHALATNVLWDLNEGRRVRSFPGEVTAISPDGRYVAASAGKYGEKPSLCLFEAATGRKLAQLEGHAKMVLGLAFSPDSRRLLSGDSEGQVVLWDVESAQQVLGFQWELADRKKEMVFSSNRSAGGLSFSPDGGQALIASNSYYMSFGPDNPQLWDLTTGQRIRVITPPLPSGAAEGKAFSAAEYLAVFSPDGRSIVTGGQQNNSGVIHWWDAATGELIRSLEGHKSNVQSLAFSPDGQYFLSTSRDSTVILWDGRSGARLRDFTGVTGWVFAAQFAPDGRRVLISTSEGAVQLWHVATGEKLAELVNVDTETNWLVATPEGLFDGSEQGRQAVTYRVGGGFTVVPVERFFQDFYRPGLLAEVWRGQRPMPVVALGAKTAPAVQIVAPAGGETVAAKHVTLTVEVTDRGGGVKGPWLVHNGARVLVTGEARTKGNTLVRTFNVPLLEGENRIEVHAASKDGSWESEPAVIVLKHEQPTEKAELYLVAVGVNRYAQESLNLRFAKPDAEAIAELFQERAPALYGSDKVHVVTVLDAQATKSGIQKAIEQVAKQAKPQDTLVVFLAGHGTTIGQRYFFITHEFKTKADKLEQDISEQGLAGDVLGDYVGAVPALKRVMIFDTCQSGGTISLTPTARNPFSFRGAMERLSRAQGVFTLAAAPATADAQELPQLGHGVLTYTLLAALGSAKGGPLEGQSLKPQGNVVEVRDWFAYAQDKVPLLTRLFFNQEQFVGFSGQGASFPVLPAKE
jgi:WD40 repeat protein